jgi:predicted nucleic acid-binding protein
VSGDPNHQIAAARLTSTPISQLVTSDYVLTELLNLLKMRRESKRAFELGRQILEGTVCHVIWVEKADVYKAWTYFETYRDKGWSFTDCVSRAVIERLNIAYTHPNLM